MSKIQIHEIIPLHDYVLLVVFADLSAGVNDCKLLVNHREELMPSRHESVRDGTAVISSDIAVAIAAEVGQSDYREYPDGEIVSIEIADDDFRQWTQWCDERNITIEKMIQALFRFCTKENQSVIERWFSDWRRESAAEILAMARQHCYSEEQFQNRFDAILAEVESGTSPIMIISNGGRELLMFEWEDYWRRLGWLHEPGERQKVEEEAQHQWEATREKEVQ